MRKLLLLVFLLLFVPMMGLSALALAPPPGTNSTDVITCDGNYECDLFLNTTLPGAPNQEPVDIVNITIFYGATCPHCHELFNYLEKLDDDGYRFNLIKYEVWKNDTNQKFAESYVSERGMEFQGVPTFFIENKSFVGYSDSMNEDIIAAIEHITPRDNLTLLQRLNLEDKSLPMLAVFLGFIDGFNPCAFFVLFFLLSMLVYAKSRARMLVIGGIFVLVSGLIYFIFMAAWLNFFLIASSITFITLIAGIVAIIIGIINVKDFFTFKKGVSLSISDKHKGKLMKKMRSLLKETSMTSMVIGTIILAISANLYELLCTAGFPMVFTKTLTENNLSTFMHYAYLALYNIAYIIPLLVIVIIFTITFNAKKLTESQGESLKLLSGLMMLFLGILLAFWPGSLSNIIAASSTIILAIILTVIITITKKRLKQKAHKK